MLLRDSSGMKEANRCCLGFTSTDMAVYFFFTQTHQVLKKVKGFQVNICV